MKKIVYRIKKERSKPYNKQYISYGVEILEDGVQTQYIPDVFTNKSHAKRLVRLCNKCDVAPIHIQDVIEDMSWEIREAQHSCV